MAKKPTEVISFRVPKDIAKRVDRQAKKEKKKRAKLVESIFTDAFERHLESHQSAALAT